MLCPKFFTTGGMRYAKFPFIFKERSCAALEYRTLRFSLMWGQSSQGLISDPLEYVCFTKASSAPSCSSGLLSMMSSM